MKNLKFRFVEPFPLKNVKFYFFGNALPGSKSNNPYSSEEGTLTPSMLGKIGGGKFFGFFEPTISLVPSLYKN